MTASSRLLWGGCLLFALSASCNQLVLAQSVGETGVESGESISENKNSSNPLDFQKNGTLGPEDLNSSYSTLIDYRNFNTAFLIENDVIEILQKLNFGAAQANNGDFGSEASKLVDERYINPGQVPEVPFGAMLVTGEGSNLQIGQYLHFSTQCQDSQAKPAGCPSKGEINQFPVSSNDYVDISGQLAISYSGNNVVNRGFRTFGGNDIVLIRTTGDVDIDADFDLGGGNDQLNLQGLMTVGSDFIAGNGNDQVEMPFGSYLDVRGDLMLGDGRDRFISRGKIKVAGDLNAGTGDDQVEIRGESPVGYGSLMVEGSVELGEGNDTFLLKAPLDLQYSPSEIKKRLFFDVGDDVLDVRLASTRLLVGAESDREEKNYNINFGEGNDTLINRGDIFSGWGIVFNGGDVDDQSGEWGDLIVNYESAKISTYAGINFSGSGRGTIDNRGTIEVGLDQTRQIIFGVGNDQIINRSGGVINVKGNIRMGDGDDLILNDGVMAATRGVDMGSGNDTVSLGGECFSSDGKFSQCITLDNGRFVDGGAGRDTLEFSDSSFSSDIPFGADASQPSSFSLQLINAAVISGRFVNFENLIQGEGRYQYEGDFSSDFESVVVRDGVFVASEKSPATFENLVLESDGTIVVGMINSGSDGDDRAPIVVTGEKGFVYSSGSFVISADQQDDPEGSYFVIQGNVVNAEALAANVTLVYDCDLSNEDCTQQQFSGLGPANGVDSALRDVYLEEGSLQIVVEPKESAPFPIKPDDSGSPDADDNGELDQLPGCDVGDDLCDVISDVDGDQDDATDQEEESSADAIDGLIDGLVENEIELPLINYGTLARLVTSGLLPRNVDAPGRSLFNYNNLLVDTVFERLPLRQFEPVELSAVVDEEAVMEEPLPAGEPLRGLWSHQPWMQNEQAEAFVGQQLAQAEVLEEVSIEMAIEGVGVVEDPSLTAQYANREGVRAWYRGFGGDLGPTSTSTLYGDYNASASGMVLGADVSIGSNVQIGAFANYGDVSLYQFAGKTGSGAWNPTGWGGGITADWWTDNVYVQGLISASSFSGSQSRNIIAINEQLGDETARGEKNVTSYAYALRLGAPFQTGRLLLEPQFTAAWTQNQESGFRENGADQLNLRYGSRTTNFLQTELGMKLALPIQSGERGEWVPNLRVAWLGDWDMNNEDQTIGYAFTDKTVGVAPLEEDQSGVLLEAGLDYTMANINSGSWKLYVRGGAEVWGGERGTDWRASGGMTWQF